MDTKQRKIQAFCLRIANQLDSTKATIPLNKKDLLHNCNTSLFKALECIRTNLDSLPVPLDNETTEMRTMSLGVIDEIRSYLAEYGESFLSWFQDCIEDQKDDIPDFHNDKEARQKAQRTCPFYYDMLHEYGRVQSICKDFSTFLKSKITIPDPEQNIENSVEEESSSEIKTDSAEKPATILSKVKTKCLKLNLGLVSGGISKTESDASLNSLAI
jgi:hypothetical protein